MVAAKSGLLAATFFSEAVIPLNSGGWFASPSSSEESFTRTSSGSSATERTDKGRFPRTLRGLRTGIMTGELESVGSFSFDAEFSESESASASESESSVG